MSNRHDSAIALMAANIVGTLVEDPSVGAFHEIATAGGPRRVFISTRVQTAVRLAREISIALEIECAGPKETAE